MGIINNMSYEYQKSRFKTILPAFINKFLSAIYINIMAARFFLLHRRIAGVVKSVPFNSAVIFPADFEFNNSGLCKMTACNSEENLPTSIGIVAIRSWLTKKALKEMYSFAKKGGKFIALPSHSGIPTRQQSKLCSLITYSTAEPVSYFKGIPCVPLEVSDFLPIGRFNLKEIEKKYDFLIVTWARDIYHKRWDVAVKLIEELCQKYKMLVVAYKGIPSSKDFSIIKKYQESGNLKFINQWVPKEEFPSLMQECRVLIVPSEKDSQPRILDQSLLLNIPIVVNEKIYGGKKLVTEKTGRLSSIDNLAESAEWVLKNLAGKVETRSWYLQNFGPYNAARLLTASINKVFGTNYRIVCEEESEFKFTANYISTIVGLPEDYKDLIIEDKK